MADVPSDAVLRKVFFVRSMPPCQVNCKVRGVMLYRIFDGLFFSGRHRQSVRWELLHAPKGFLDLDQRHLRYTVPYEKHWAWVWHGATDYLAAMIVVE